MDSQAGNAGAVVARDGYVFARGAAGESPWQPNWVSKRFIELRDDRGSPATADGLAALLDAAS